MRKFSFLVALTTLLGQFSFISNLHSDPLVTESPIESISTPACVSISTSAYTAAPSSDSARHGVIVNNPASNNATIHGVFATAAPSVATRTAVIELQVGEWSSINVDDGVSLYWVSQHTSAEDICVQEFKQ